MNTKSMSLAALLDALDKKDCFVDRSRFSGRDFISAAGAPWYLQFFLAIGTCVAFSFFAGLLGFMGFPGLTPMFQSIVGLAFVMIAILIYQTVGDEDRENVQKAGDILAIQVSFLLITIGKFIVFYHLYKYLNLTKAWQLGAVVACVAALTFRFYRLPLEHILSFALVLLTLTYTFSGLLSVFFIVFCLLVAVYLSFSLRWSEYRYLRVAFVLPLFSSWYLWSHSGYDFALLSSFAKDIPGLAGMFDFWPRLFSVLVTLLLIGCAFYLYGKKRIDFSFGLLAAALLALSFFLPTGVFFALLVMMIGYAKYEKILLTIGVLLLVYYLSMYYYRIDVSLLNKSWLLMGSGLVLLLTAAVIAKMGWHKQVRPEAAE